MNLWMIVIRISAPILWDRRTISADWRRRIRNNDFIYEHYSVSKTYNPCLIFDFTFNLHGRHVPINALFKVDDDQTHHLTYFQPHPTLTAELVSEIVGVSHGLVCLIYEIAEE